MSHRTCSLLTALEWMFVVLPKFRRVVASYEGSCNTICGESKRRRNPSRMGPVRDQVVQRHRISNEPRSLRWYCPKLCDAA
ncbi:hypothetical protein EDC04DRAFT_2713343, partial [Pisolithus marmoratus]